MSHGSRHLSTETRGRRQTHSARTKAHHRRRSTWRVSAGGAIGPPAQGFDELAKRRVGRQIHGAAERSDRENAAHSLQEPGRHPVAAGKDRPAMDEQPRPSSEHGDIAMAIPELGFWITLAVLGLLMCVAIIQGRIKDQLGRVERKVDFLLGHAGLDITKLAGAEITELMRAGKKIEAIKAYRQLTGASLAEAKAHVESLPVTDR